MRVWRGRSRSVFLAFGIGASLAPAGYATGTVSEVGQLEARPSGTSSVETDLRRPRQADPLRIRITYPRARGRYPLIVFSHGAGGSGDNYQDLTRFWSEHGYVVVQPTHLDSRKALGRMPRREELSRWGERASDIRLILDSIQPIERVLGPTRRVDTTRVGVGGHSLGAQTAQLIGGVRPGGATPYAGQDLADNRADAILVLSGQGAGREFDEQSWVGAVLPMLVITGTNDESASAGRDSTWRREPFDRAPPGGKHLLFIKDAYHGFGGISGARLPGPNAGPPNEAHVRIVQTATLRFWDAYLKNDPAARRFFGQEQASNAFQEQATLISK